MAREEGIWISTPDVGVKLQGRTTCRLKRRLVWKDIEQKVPGISWDLGV